MHQPQKLFKAEKIEKKSIWRQWKMMLPLTVLILLIIWAGQHYQWNIQVVAGLSLLLGFATGLISWLLAVIGLIPWIGPIVVKVLSLSFIWILNAVGYLVSYIAIRRGYSKDVVTYRLLTIALLSGIVIGFVIAQFVRFS